MRANNIYCVRVDRLYTHVFLHSKYTWFFIHNSRVYVNAHTANIYIDANTADVPHAHEVYVC